MRREAVVALAQALVRVPSVNPAFAADSAGESAVGDAAAAWARRAGLDAVRDEALPGRHNVVVRVANGRGPHLLLCGHLDTVGIAGMAIAPFSGAIAHGRLWGRGACDMKGPIAAMLIAAERLANTRPRWRGTLSVGLVVDEEHAFRGALRLVQRWERPDFAVVGEPTSLAVVRGCKGCLRLRLVAHGRAAHSSDPTRGRSAIVAVARAVLALERFFARSLAKVPSDGFTPATGSIGLIRGGSGINVVADRASIDLDVRLVPGQDWRAVRDAIAARVRRATAGLRGIAWEFPPPLLVDAPFALPAHAPLPRAACAAFGRRRAGTAAFGCDASRLAISGVPTIVAGPGSIAQAHTADEWIALASLERAVAGYVALAARLMPA